MNKKILSIAIPVYNTEKYIKRCMDSILIKSIVDDIEIILINDGSKDNSLVLLNQYRNEYPNSVIVVDKKNGGHGSAINVALKMASGKYFRVLDSDDWFDSSNFIRFIEKLKNQDSDLVVTTYRKEYVYNEVSEKIYWTDLEEEKLYNFDTFDLKLLNKDYFVMANSTYKTKLLKNSNLKLLENTFYVDMQYNIIPIQHIKTFQFMNLDIYRYFIGRSEQSMNMQNFVNNRADHEKVMKFLIEYYNKNINSFSDNKKNYIEQILYYMLITHYYIFCVYANNKKTIYKEIHSFDMYLKNSNLYLYNKMNSIGQIRYNRKTNFLFTRINPNFFSRLIRISGRFLKLKGE